MTRVRKVRLMPAIVLMTCWASAASADPISVEFEITGFDGPESLTGSFTGEDSGGAGFLNAGFLNTFEITAYSLSWSGNSATPVPFTHNLGNLGSLLYHIGSQTLLNVSSGNGSSASYINTIFFGSFASVDGPESGRFPWSRDPDKQKIHGPGVTTTTVPEPGTLTLFGMGLLAASFASRRRRARV